MSNHLPAITRGTPISRAMEGGRYAECHCGEVVGVDARGRKWAVAAAGSMLIYGDRWHVHRDAGDTNE